MPAAFTCMIPPRSAIRGRTRRDPRPQPGNLHRHDKRPPWHGGRSSVVALAIAKNGWSNSRIPAQKLLSPQHGAQCMQHHGAALINLLIVEEYIAVVKPGYYERPYPRMAPTHISSPHRAYIPDALKKCVCGRPECSVFKAARSRLQNLRLSQRRPNRFQSPRCQTIGGPFRAIARRKSPP